MPLALERFAENENSRYLWHLTAERNPAAIKRHGLWSAAGLNEDASSPIDLTISRRDLAHVRHPVFGDVVLRDQQALNPAKLRWAHGHTVEDLLRDPNGRVFFRPSDGVELTFRDHVDLPESAQVSTEGFQGFKPLFS